MFHVKHHISTIQGYRIQFFCLGDEFALLRVYNRKSLHERVSGIFNLSSKEYPNLVLRLLKSDKKEMVINALKQYTPNLD